MNRVLHPRALVIRYPQLAILRPIEVLLWVVVMGIALPLALGTRARLDLVPDSLPYMLLALAIGLGALGRWTTIQWRSRRTLPRGRLASIHWSPAVAALVAALFLAPTVLVGKAIDASIRGLRTPAALAEDLREMSWGSSYWEHTESSSERQTFCLKIATSPSARAALIRYQPSLSTRLAENGFDEDLEGARKQAAATDARVTSCARGAIPELEAGIAQALANVQRIARAHGEGRDYCPSEEPAAPLVLSCLACLLGALIGLASMVPPKVPALMFGSAWVGIVLLQALHPFVRGIVSMTRIEMAPVLKVVLGAAAVGYHVFFAAWLVRVLRRRARDWVTDYGIIVVLGGPLLSIAALWSLLPEAFQGRNAELFAGLQGVVYGVEAFWCFVTLASWPLLRRYRELPSAT